MNVVSFPGLGLGPIELNRVAFTLLGKPFYWYGIIAGAGFLLGLLVALWQVKRLKVNVDHFIDTVLLATPFAIIGARAYYVLMRLDYYDSFYSAIAIWEGGLAIYGGVIGGVLAALIYCRARKINVWEILDVAGGALLLGQAIGRWGNFINVEAYGYETTLPWRMQLASGVAVHPTFLYESLIDIAGVVLILLLTRHRKFKGELFWVYMGWYGLGRAFVEGLRTDSLMLGSVRISQLLGVLFFLVSVAMIVMNLRRIKRQKLDETEYTPVFSENLAAAEGMEQAGPDETAEEPDAEETVDAEVSVEEAAEASARQAERAEAEAEAEEAGKLAGEDGDLGGEPESENENSNDNGEDA